MTRKYTCVDLFCGAGGLCGTARLAERPGCRAQETDHGRTGRGLHRRRPDLQKNR